MSTRYYWRHLKGSPVNAICCLGVCGGLSVAGPGLAQPVPDNTLGEESSTVTRIEEQPANTSSSNEAFLQYPQIVIEGGALRTIIVGDGFDVENSQSSGNLFHSFEAFDIDSSTPVFIDIPTFLTVATGDLFGSTAQDIQNVIVRVTGNQASSIDGVFGLRDVISEDESLAPGAPTIVEFNNSSANLFLLNPNGVIFGPNSSLELGGSLTVSGGDSIAFEDGSEFSAVMPSTDGLTVSTPLGVQLNPASLPSGNVDITDGISGIQNLSLLGNQVLLSGTLAPELDLTLIGQDIELNNAELFGPRTDFDIMADGSVSLRDSSLTANEINIQATNDAVSLESSSINSFPGSNTVINAPELLLSNGSEISINAMSGSTITINADRVIAADGGNDILASAETEGPVATFNEVVVNANQLIGFNQPDEGFPLSFLTNNQDNDISLSPESVIGEFITELEPIPEPEPLPGPEPMPAPMGEPNEEGPFMGDQLTRDSTEGEETGSLVDSAPTEATELALIAAGCAIDRGDRDTFVVTGRAGLPPQVGDLAAGRSVNVPWVTTGRQASAVQRPQNRAPQFLAAPSTPAAPLIEAQSLVIDGEGNAYFVAGVEGAAGATALQRSQLSEASPLCTARS